MIRNNKYKVEYVKSTHNAGFFSCCSIRLDDIIKFFNKYKLLPIKVDSSKQFEWYKNGNNDITFDYFEYYKNVYIYPIYKNNINYVGDTDQFKDYKKIDYESICPFVEKYFTPSVGIKNLISHLETKYKITDYTQICVLFYRGNDKMTETNLCSYNDIIDKAKIIFNTNNNVKFLIQSDETEFIQKCKSIFINNICFDNYCRHIHTNKQLSIQNLTNDKMEVFKYGQYFLSISYIMSKCKYIICPTGNCSLWIILFRGNCDGVYQNKDKIWY